MSLSIAHINHDYEPLPQPKPKKQSKQEVRVNMWIARQYQKQYDEAIRENLADILEIQKSMPGWMPKKELLTTI